MYHSINYDISFCESYGLNNCLTCGRNKNLYMANLFDPSRATMIVDPFATQKKKIDENDSDFSSTKKTATPVVKPTTCPMYMERY